MSKRVQRLGHIEADANAFTGLAREITIDTTNNELRIHNGSTVGGIPIKNKTQNDTLYQSLDATLTALAGVTVAADKLIYATAADTFTTTDLTAFARTLISSADVSTFLTGLGTTGVPQFAGLGIGRAPTVDLDILVSDTATAFLIENTNDGVNVVTGIDLYRNSATPQDNDELLGITFSGKDDGGSKQTYATIVSRIFDASAGDENGWLDFRFIVNGAEQTGLRLNTSPAGSEISIQGRSGGASGPTFSFQNDTNTGMYQSQDDVVTIAAGGEQILELLNSGGGKLQLMSDDVAHGITGQAPTKVFGEMKIPSDAGALDIVGLTEASIAMRITGMETTPSTTDTTGSGAVLVLRGAKKSGTGVTTMGATENTIALDAWGSTIVLFKGDGTVHAVDTSWATALDTYNDVKLTRMFTKHMARSGYVQSKWDKLVGDHAVELRKARVFGSINPETGRPDMIAIQPTIMLAYGAIWKLTEEIMAMLETQEKRDPGYIEEFKKTLMEGANRAPVLLAA